MIILLSPAKSLDFDTPAPRKKPTSAQFAKEASVLMQSLRKQSATGLSKLMKLSEDLSTLNFERNQRWTVTHTAKNSKPAVYAFQGDVYQGLTIDELSAADVQRCQKHVRILSGLYGVLRPLDLIQPYRLEMGTKLKNAGGKNLYEFWGDTVRDAIADDLQAMKGKLVVNLASKEYSRVAKLKTLDAKVISPAFKDWNNGQYKLISFFAKRARGLMARYLITNNVKKADGLLGFDLDGYSWNAEMSSDTEPVFTRKI